MNFLSRFLKDLKTYARSPQMISLWVLLGLATVMLVINFWFIPKLYIALTAIIFFGIGIAIVNNTLRLARLSIQTGSSQEELDAVINNLPDGVIIYNPDFKILLFNKAAEGIFQISKNDVLGKYVDPSLVQNPRFKILTQALFPSLAPSIVQLSELNTWPQQVNITLEDPKLELVTILHRIVNSQGKLTSFLKITKDWTREKNILKSKDEFINIAAHQLRTPLTAIRWGLENLKNLTAKDSPEIKDLVLQTFQISERALKITNDLLDVSKIEEGRFGYDFEDSDFITITENVINAVLPVAKQYGVIVQFMTREKKPLTLHVDVSRITTAFLNLLDNAIKYNIKGGTVTVSIEKLQNAPFIKVTIADTGVGIPPDEIKKLFQKLYRGSNVAQLEPNGSGLGLYITKNIIKRHGGDITVSSTLNRGTTFTFTLPTDPERIPRKELTHEEL